MPSPLIENMIEQYEYPVLSEETLDDYINAQQECVLFFTENPKQFPESDDVAMILPEIIKAYGGRLKAAVISTDSQRKIQKKYGFNEWPTLIFLREGKYLGTISRVQDWADYLENINEILASEPKHAPGIGIPVVQASSSQCKS